LIPAGLLVTVPLPVMVTVSPGSLLKVADTLAAALSVTVHVVLLPLQLPLQPVNV
jgi:hypothetical protein